MTDIFVKISKPEQDVQETDPQKFVLSSEWATIKFLDQAAGTVTVPASSNATVTLANDWVGGRPLVLLFVELTPSSGRWYVSPFASAQIGTEDVYVSENIDDTHASVFSATNVIFKLVNTTASDKVIKYYYFVIGETGKD